MSKNKLEHKAGLEEVLIPLGKLFGAILVKEELSKVVNNKLEALKTYLRSLNHFFQ
jgi:hypothetical protein